MQRTLAYSDHAPVVMTVAGSDSCGGAGIQADLKTFTALGVYGCSVLTAVTAQNTKGVQRVSILDPRLVLDQLAAIVEDLPPKAVKIGMLGSFEVVEVLAQALAGLPGSPPIVLDPVMLSKSGARLLGEGAAEALQAKLFPLSTLVTPNFEEAIELTEAKGISKDEAGLKELGERLMRLGARAALVKGGHLQGQEAIDVLFLKGKVVRFAYPRVQTRHGHGTGCTLSSAIAAYLALGESLEQAVAKAKTFVYLGLLAPALVGRGVRPVNTLAYLERETGRHGIIERLKKASRRFMEACPLEHIPEVGSNLVEALPVAQGPEEVAGFPARIMKTKHGILVPLGPEFGGSDHMARLVLAAMETFPDVRAAMNLAYSKKLVQAMKDAGLRIERFDRLQIPREVEEIEGRTLPYLVKRWAESGVGALDALFDEGDKGKEPMVRILGPDALEVVEKVLRALKKAGRGERPIA